jgi:hypothetical protein
LIKRALDAAMKAGLLRRTDVNVLAMFCSEPSWRRRW